MSISILICRINEELSQLPHVSSERCIGKVYDQLRGLHVEAYEPAIVAIGPYHRRKSGLQEMKQHKLRYLQDLLRRTGESSLGKLVEAVREMDEAARKYYAGTIDLDTDEFVEMMLVDGCFIIEFFRKLEKKELRDRDDPIFESAQILVHLMRDLILLENQLPFMILVKLFDMTKGPNTEDNISLMASIFVEDILLPNNILRPLTLPKEVPVVDKQHLLGLVYYTLCYPLSETHGSDFGTEEFRNSATELEEFGVRFKRAEFNSLFDIKFRNGVLEIPPLSINDDVETLLRNLVAYEQCLPGNQRSYVCDYLVFMDCLINSLEDVHLLRRSGIIENEEADDAKVYAMLSKVDKHILIGRWEFTYSEISRHLNTHCNQRRNIWMAYLRRTYFKPLKKNYFHNPWAFVSFLAAVVLLLLTITQTIFSVLSVTLN